MPSGVRLACGKTSTNNRVDAAVIHYLWEETTSLDAQFKAVFLKSVLEKSCFRAAGEAQQGQGQGGGQGTEARGEGREAAGQGRLEGGGRRGRQ